VNDAAPIPPGVTLFCDPPLAPALRKLDPISRRQAGAPVAVLSAPAAAMLAQIQRHTRNDVLFTLSTAMDQAEQWQLVVPATRIDGFSNPLVLARMAGRPAIPLASATLALTDNTPASGLDGRLVLAANGLAAKRLLGAANTGDVAFLVTTGAADYGLLYATDAAADPRLTIFAPLTADPALTRYSGAVNAKAVSPNAAALLTLMQGPEGRAALRAAGLAAVS
jgi:molybdate transport system substrate-binding protein